MCAEVCRRSQHKAGTALAKYVANARAEEEQNAAVPDDTEDTDSDDDWDVRSDTEDTSEDTDSDDDGNAPGPSTRALVAAFTAAYESDCKRQRR